MKVVKEGGLYNGCVRQRQVSVSSNRCTQKHLLLNSSRIFQYDNIFVMEATNSPQLKIFPWSDFKIELIPSVKAEPASHQLKIDLNTAQLNLLNDFKLHKPQQFKDLMLQIRSNWIAVAEIDQNQNTVLLDFFECRPEIGFQFIRVQSIDNTQQINEQKIKFGIGFSLSSSVVLSIVPSSQSQIDQFQKALSKQYLIQPNFHALHKPIRLIGQGVTASVFSTMNLKTKDVFASKSFGKSKYFKSANNTGKQSYQKQFKILTKLNHRNLAQLYAVFQTQNSIYMIMQLMNKSLMGCIVQNQPMPTEMITRIMYCLLDGINYLHSMGIMHRDIKLENIMMRVNCNSQLQPVLIDFGLAQYFKSPPYLYTQCGTPGYISPQTFSHKPIPHPQLCDIFALGVILHIMMFGKGIFRGDKVPIVIQKNKKGEMDICEGGHPSLKQLLLRMLQKDNAKRITAADALAHPAFQKMRDFSEQSKEISNITIPVRESSSPSHSVENQ